MPDICAGADLPPRARREAEDISLMLPHAVGMYHGNRHESTLLCIDACARRF
jgi:hypothetical protein